MVDLKFAKEGAAVEELIYDALHDEVHELGKKLYYESGDSDEIHRELENDRNKKCDEFLLNHPEYSARAFLKVYNFVLNEGVEMAKEMA